MRTAEELAQNSGPVAFQKIHAWRVSIPMLEHKLKIYSEAKGFHHAPAIPATMAGNYQINQTHIFIPLLYGEAPELIERQAKAFEKVWAHRSELAKL